jgi:hypothetical protein
MAFTEREIVDGIQQIRLPHPVIPEKTVHLGRTVNFRLQDILVI